MPTPSRIIIASLSVFATTALAAAPQPADFTAEGHDSRIDLTWSYDPAHTHGFHVYRADQADGPFERLTKKPHPITVYSDFLGRNDITRWYRITVVDATGKESDHTDAVHAKTRNMTTDELLTSIQKAHFRYFWDFAHPHSGLTREGFKHDRRICTSGGTGFGLITIMVGAERGFVTRQAAAERILKQIRFLEDTAERFHGHWPHWLDGRTGKVIPFFDPRDNGADIVESAFLLQGMLTVAQYFDQDNTAEREIRERVKRLWHEAEWSFFRGDPPGDRVFWHWSPDQAFAKNHRIGDHFNECQIVYILGMAAPNDPLPLDAFVKGWIHDPKKYGNGNEYYGFKLAIGFPYGGPLFFTHYSFLGFDPRALTDQFGNYYDHFRTITRINHAHCVANPKGYKGYSDKVWGLTASTGFKGYHAHAPRTDRGTIAPTGAISAMPYAPELSLPTLKHFYHELGPKIWGHLGFWDAFNLTHDWVSPTYLAIDQGPIVPMIENYRTQLCWRMFMQNPEIMSTLQRSELLAEGYTPKAPLPAGKDGQ
jgi:hypothetical protein